MPRSISRGFSMPYALSEYLDKNNLGSKYVRELLFRDYAESRFFKSPELHALRQTAEYINALTQTNDLFYGKEKDVEPEGDVTRKLRFTTDEMLANGEVHPADDPASAHLYEEMIAEWEVENG